MADELESYTEKVATYLYHTVDCRQEFYRQWSSQIFKAAEVRTPHGGRHASSTSKWNNLFTWAKIMVHGGPPLMALKAQLVYILRDTESKLASLKASHARVPVRLQKETDDDKIKSIRSEEEEILRDMELPQKLCKILRELSDFIEEAAIKGIPEMIRVYPEKFKQMPPATLVKTRKNLFAAITAGDASPCLRRYSRTPKQPEIREAAALDAHPERSELQRLQALNEEQGTEITFLRSQLAAAQAKEVAAAPVAATVQPPEEPIEPLAEPFTPSERDSAPPSPEPFTPGSQGTVPLGQVVKQAANAAVADSAFAKAAAPIKKAAALTDKTNTGCTVSVNRPPWRP